MLARIAISTLAALQIAVAQRVTEPLPRFEDYPVAESFDSTPHPPIIRTSEHRRYRTIYCDHLGVWDRVHHDSDV